jgi:hypothetical protein
MHANSQSLTSVKLFPRLANPRRKSRPRLAALVDSADPRRAQVRARLLQMILTNEDARRNDRRPSAS